MRKLYKAFVASLFVLSTGILHAQDLIVTVEGDSVNCKITKQSNGFVYFRYLKDNQTKVTLLPVNKISSIVQAYYDAPVINTMHYELPRSRDYSKWRYGFHGGYSYRIAKVSDQVTSSYQDYFKKLKSGFVVGADVHGFTSESFGIGVKYNLNKYKAEQGSNLKDDITLHYVAASMLNRYVLADPANHFLFGANIGLQSYRDKAMLMGYDLDITGKAVGFGLEAGYEHKIGNGALLHFGLMFTGASITKIRINGGTPVKLSKEEYESLSRLELVLGFKFGQ